MNQEKVMKSPFSVMSKISAIKFLIKNSVYGNEWQGAGMYEAVEKMMEYKGRITAHYLIELLKEAEDR